MRKIEHTNQFKRDFKKNGSMDASLIEVLYKLANDEVLSPKYCDHSLSGEWSDHRDCHVKPDYVLIYRKVGVDVLQLVRIGSHSELGL